MGAWGIGFFDDDTALDVLDEFEQIDDVKEFMSNAFNNALNQDYLEYDDGINVLVSAALIDVAVNSTKHEILSDEYGHIIKQIKKLKLESLKSSAINALKLVIAENSELNELWGENEDEYPNWKANIESLISRLSK